MSDTKPFERLRYFNGRLLTAGDFQQEQDYFREKHKLHNRALHGFGIVSGLKLSKSSGEIVVSAGLAIDCEGNELIVETDRTLKPALTGAATYLNLRFVEHSIIEAEATEATIVRETAELDFGAQNFNANHRHQRGRWLACETSHPLTIGRLRADGSSWRIDRRYRAPIVK